MTNSWKSRFLKSYAHYLNHKSHLLNNKNYLQCLLERNKQGSISNDVDIKETQEVPSRVWVLAEDDLGILDE